MKVNTNKKNVFKRVINIILAVLMGIVAFISVGVFTLACIGSCSSKTATVKADNSDVALYNTSYVSNDVGSWFFGNEIMPSVNFYPRVDLGFPTGSDVPYSSALYPNGTVNEFYDCGFSIALVNRSIDSLSLPSYVDKSQIMSNTLPFLLIRGGFKYYIDPFNFYLPGSDGNKTFLPSSNILIGGSSVIFQSLPLAFSFHNDGGSLVVDDYSKFESSCVYGYCDNPSFSNGYSCVYYSGDVAFDCLNVRQVRYSSKFIDYNGLTDVFANILTFVDDLGNSIAVEFICQDVFYNSFRTSLFMWDNRTYFVDSSITDDDKYQAGFDDGFGDGYDEGFRDGVLNGEGDIDGAYNSGYNAGYSKGFQDGASDKLTSQNFFNKVFSIFDVKIFGFMSLGDIFKIVFVLGIGIWALKVFAGG